MKDEDERSPASGPVPQTVPRLGNNPDLPNVARPNRTLPASTLGEQPNNDVASVLGSEGCRRILRLLLLDPELNLDSTSLSRLLGWHQTQVSLYLNDFARIGLLAKQRRGLLMVYRASPHFRATLEANIKVPASGDQLPVELILLLHGNHPNRGAGARTEQQGKAPTIGRSRVIGPTAGDKKRPTVQEGGDVDNDQPDHDEGQPGHPLAIAGEPERVSPRPRPDQGDRLGRAHRTPAVVERSAKTAET